jgi:adenylosuccinate lyase
MKCNVCSVLISVKKGKLQLSRHNITKKHERALNDNNSNRTIEPVVRATHEYKIRKAKMIISAFNAKQD